MIEQRREFNIPYVTWKCATKADVYLLLVERTRAGLEVARAQERVDGRKPVMTDSKLAAARKLLAGGVAPREVAANLGISVPTLYRWIPAGEGESK